MTLENPQTSITLKSLKLDVFLGWPVAERAEEQQVIIDINIQFQKPPAGCFTDNLADTYCYDTLIKAVRKTVAAKQFRLLEHLGHEIYQTIKQAIASAKIGIHVKKNPPIQNLTGGVSFYFGD
jgi:FolB domain-containing protein